MRGNVAATVLVVLGCYFLANNLGWIDVSLWHVLKVWWPVVLIIVGVGLFLSPKEKIPPGSGTSSKNSG